jgi:hypothetical protein
LRVSDDSDWDLFERVAGALRSRFGGEWEAQLDGPDQRYWDLRVGEGLVTLHLEHYVGISIFAAPAASAPEASAELLEEISAHLSSLELSPA